MPGLPPYRRVTFTITAPPGVDSAELAAHLVDGLRPFGVPEMQSVDVLDYETVFNGEIDPPGSIAECLAALRAISPDCWLVDPFESTWLQIDNPTPFLHPSVTDVSLACTFAPTLPKFAEGDQVRILDCPSATRDGLVGTIGPVRYSVYVHSEGAWRHAVKVPGKNGPFQFGESELEAVT